MNTENNPYRSAQSQSVIAPTVDDPFLTQPIEEVFNELRRSVEQRRPPAWWVKHVKRHIKYRGTDDPTWTSFLAATIYWSIVIPYWLLGAPYIWHLMERRSWENITAWGITFFASFVVQALIIVFAAFIEGEGDFDFTLAFLYTVFPPSSLWLTGKDFTAWIICRYKGGFDIVPWQDSVALINATTEFVQRCIKPEQQKVNRLNESLETLKRELAAIEKRRTTFEEQAHDAGGRGNTYLQSQQTRSAQIESDRAANVREQMAHTRRYTQIAADGIKSLETSTEQYKELQESRLKLRETDSLSPHDTSDAELRAHMRQILIDIREAIKTANAPVTRTRVDTTPPAKEVRPSPISMDEELERMANEELRQRKT